MEMKDQYLVPQAVIDCATSLLNANNVNVRSSYEQRIEATRKFCEDVLKQNKIMKKQR